MYRTITIEAVLNGFVAHVGCQRVVFNEVDALLQALKAYYGDPEKVEQNFTNSQFAKHVYDGGPAAAPAPTGGSYGLGGLTRAGDTACVPKQAEACAEPRSEGAQRRL